MPCDYRGAFGQPLPPQCGSALMAPLDNQRAWQLATFLFFRAILFRHEPARTQSTWEVAMDIKELGYLVMDVTDLDAWQTYAEEILGMMVGTRTATAMTLRMDERACRWLLRKAEQDRLVAAGWLVDSRKDLKTVAAELEANGYLVIESDEQERLDRRVNAMIATLDPAGVRHEFAWGPVANFAVPFFSKAGVHRFVTAKQGLGHLVVGVAPELFAAEEHFIEDVLGFTLANFRRQTVVEGREPIRLDWYGLKNGRHHCFAIGERAAAHPVQHVMIEVDSIDDVGRALDRSNKAQVQLASTLGRHANDAAISFYSVTPSKFWIEYGHVLPGASYDEISWDDGCAGSRWGHEFRRDLMAS